VIRLRFKCILSLALLGGCAGGSQDTTLEIVNDVCEPTTIIAPADATGEQLASIDGAIAMWTQLGFDRIARGDGAPLAGGQQIPIVFDDAAEFFHGLYDDEHGVVYINRALSGDPERAITMAHELGHAFGLWHVDRGARWSVMNPNNLAIEPNDGDAAELVALWGACGD
jgi:hypothetical protein